MVGRILDALWKNVLDRWEEDRAHGAFLEHCQTTDQLAEAAARYRGMKGDRERGASAEKRLAGVAIVALAKLEATRSPRPQGGLRSGSLIFALLCVLLTFGLMAYLWWQRHPL